MNEPLSLLVLNPLANRHREMLTDAAPGCVIRESSLEEAGPLLADTDILVLWGSTDAARLVPDAPRLRWLHALSAGVEGLACPAVTERGILLTNSRGIHGIPVAEHVLGMMVHFSRGLGAFQRQQTLRVWRRSSVGELYGSTLGIVGLGAIGREIAKRGKAFGMEVLGCRRNPSSEIFVDEMVSPDSLAAMLGRCDYVVVALPLVPDTRKLFGSDLFRAMRPGSCFINIARGQVVDEDALVDALRDGTIGSAALDVFETEPLPADSPLWKMENVLITPHVAALSPCYLDRAIKLLADNLVRFRENSDMLNVIDPRLGY